MTSTQVQTAARAYGLAVVLWLIAFALLYSAMVVSSWLLFIAGVAFAAGAASWFDTGSNRARRRDQQMSYSSPDLRGSHRT